MKGKEKIAFQNLILDAMKQQRRRAFRGHIAAKLWVSASASNPPHLYNAIKNILDLFAAPVDPRVRRKGLVYYDDSQIWALSVAYDVKSPRPGVYAMFAPASSFIEDLWLASQITSATLPHSDDLAKEIKDGQSDASDIEKYVEFRREDWLGLGGPSLDRFSTYVKKYKAQIAILNQSKLGIGNLCNLYAEAGMLPGGKMGENSRMIAVLSSAAEFARTVPFRLLLPRPPEKTGESKQFRSDVDRSLAEFKERYGDLFFLPFLTPVALEVAYKPALGTLRQKEDLDNLLRIILTQFNRHFEPPANHELAWQDLLPHEPNSDRLPPRSLEKSIIRLDVFRILRRPSDKSPGFLVLGLAPVTIGFEDAWSRSDDIIKRWSTETGSTF